MKNLWLSSRKPKPRTRNLANASKQKSLNNSAEHKGITSTKEGCYVFSPFHREENFAHVKARPIGQKKYSREEISTGCSEAARADKDENARRRKSTLILMIRRCSQVNYRSVFAFCALCSVTCYVCDRKTEKSCLGAVSNINETFFECTKFFVPTDQNFYWT